MHENLSDPPIPIEMRMQWFGTPRTPGQMAESRADKAKSRRTVKAAQTNYKHPLGRKHFHMPPSLPAKCKSISQNTHSYADPLRTLLILFL